MMQQIYNAISDLFETLPESTIIHIFSFLPGAELLKLSKVDKKFKTIISNSRKTMSKITLVLDFYKPLDLDCVNELTQTRHFLALRLHSSCKLHHECTDDKLPIALLQILSYTIEDLTIQGKLPTNVIAYILNMFLPKLETCKIEIVPTRQFDGQLCEVATQTEPKTDHPLKSLTVKVSTTSSVINVFAGCTQLKTFHYERCDDDGEATNTEEIDDFVAAQEHLIKLNLISGAVPWNKMKSFKLEELTTACLPQDELAASTFLKKLPNITTLSLQVFNKPTRILVETICNKQELTSLTIRNWDDQIGSEQDDDAYSLNGLINKFVKKLTIYDYTGIASELLKIFVAPESVKLGMRTATIDLSDVPFQTIEKIKIERAYPYRQDLFHVKFSPKEIPLNVTAMESSMKSFAQEFNEFISSINIGHETWRNTNFRLSNSFCEELLICLPNLLEVEIINISNPKSFNAFLTANATRWKLENVILTKPFGAKEQEKKKIKIEN